MYKAAEFKRATEDCQCIANGYWAGVCWMHLRFVIVAQKNNVEMIVILYIANCLICKKGCVRNSNTCQAKELTFHRDGAGHICTCGCSCKNGRGHFSRAQCNKSELIL